MLNSPCLFCVYFDTQIPGTLKILLVSKKSTLSSDRTRRPTRSGKARHLSHYIVIFPKLSLQTMHGTGLAGHAASLIPSFHGLR